MGIKLKIVTPDGLFIDNKDVEIINLQSIDGDMGILKGIIPLITALKIGILSFRDKHGTTYVHVHRGVAKVDGETCTVITQRLYLVDANKVRMKTPDHLE